MAEEIVCLDLENGWREKSKSIRELSEDEMKLLISMFPEQKKLFENFASCKTCLEKVFGEGFWTSLLKTYLTPYGVSIFTLKAGEVFYRARIYGEKLPIDELEKRIEGEPKSLSPFFGYGAKDSGAPSPELCKNPNRCSPSGVSYLYVSSSAKCAVSETFHGSLGYISVAKMVTKSPITILNFARTGSDGREAIDEKSEEKGKEEIIERNWLNDFIYSVNLIFADPEAPCYVKDPYLVCQTIAEAASELGFGGVAYRSEKSCCPKESDNFNYAFFYPDCAEAASSTLHQVLQADIVLSPELK